LVFVAAPTGAAAVFVGGETVHALTALSSNQNDDGNGSQSFENLASGGQALKRLQARFERAIFVFQDEIVMTDAFKFWKKDTRISQAKIREANPNLGPFGGCNTILLGHHAKLSPATEDRLYAPPVRTNATLLLSKGSQATGSSTLWWFFGSRCANARRQRPQKSKRLALSFPHTPS
jgi:hypothetical protein